MITHLTFDGALRSEVSPTIIDVLTRKGWVEVSQPPFNPETETCEWVDGAWSVSSIVAQVPDSVPMWSLREAVIKAGQKTDLENAINGLPEPEKSVALNRWEYKETILRRSQIISSLQSILGWSDGFVDDLYREAIEISRSQS